MKQSKTSEKRQPKQDDRKVQEPPKSDLASIPKAQLVQSIKRDIKRLVRN